MLEPLQELTLKDRVAGRLRQAILAGSLAPGTALSERDIAAQLGVSRTPVREAFSVLEREGLILLSPHREVKVIETTAESRHEASRLRALLESYALQLALRTDPAGLERSLSAELPAFTEPMPLPTDQAEWEPVLAASWEADMRFHAAIVAGAGQVLLRDVWRARSAITWMPPTPASLTPPLAAPAYLHTQRQQHQAIVEAVQAGQARQAAGVLVAHILGAEGLPPSDDLAALLPTLGAWAAG